MTVIKLIGLFCLFISVAVCQGPPMLTVQGISGTSVTFSTSDLASLPQQTVKNHRPRNTRHISRHPLDRCAFQGCFANWRTVLPHGGVVLSACGRRGRLPGGIRMGGTGLDLMDKSIYVVTMRDGKPLSEDEGAV